MKRLIISLLLAVVLAASMVLPAFAADEQSVGTSVEVGYIINITLTDVNGGGINFGTVIPGNTAGDIDQGEGQASIAIATGAENNVVVDIYIKGTLPLKPIWKCSDDYAGVRKTITDSYELFGAGGVAKGTSAVFWNWIEVPVDTTPDTYTGTIYYKAVPTGSVFP